MLNTFEPKTTPAAVAADPLATAETDDEISGESAPSATIKPTTPPSRPRLCARRPTPRTRNSLAANVATSAMSKIPTTVAVCNPCTGDSGPRPGCAVMSSP